jgi:hypothetical protein
LKVVPELANICFTANVFLNLKTSVSLMIGDGATGLPNFVSLTSSP